MKSEMTFDQIYAQCKLVVETSEIEKKHLESQENLCAYDICKISELEKDIEFYSKIAEACEKQIAKKPIYGDSNYRTEDNSLGREITCGECSEQICYEHSVIEHFKFCNECGTKIDWGKDDE